MRGQYSEPRMVVRETRVRATLLAGSGRNSNPYWQDTHSPGEQNGGYWSGGWGKPP